MIMTLEDAKPVNPKYAAAIGYKSPTAGIGEAFKDEFMDLGHYWLGPESGSMQLIGQGTYGSVFKIHVKPAMKDIFESIFGSHEFSYKVGYLRTIPSHKYVAMKIILMPRGKDDGGSYASMVREIRTHWKLCGKSPLTIGGKTYDVQKVIPKLYAAGFDRRARAAVMFMEFMNGYRLADIVNYLPRHPRVVANIEYAIACLFLNGFLHIDFHPGNIFVDMHSAEKKVKIFDFGFAAELEPRYIAVFAKYLQTRGPAAIKDFWHDVGETYGDAAIVARHHAYPRTPLRWYRNVTILGKLENLVNPAELDHYRHATWIPAQLSTYNHKRAARRLAVRRLHLKTWDPKINN